MEPPTPCKMRASVNSVRFSLSPQSMDATVNVAMAALKTNRVPNRPDIHALAGMKKLKKLNLQKTRIADGAMAKLAPLTELTELNLSENEITPAALDAMPQFKELQKLEVENCFLLSPSALDALREKMPGLKIIGP